MDKGHFDAKIKQVDTKRRTLTGYGSTADRDRQDEVILPSAWAESVAAVADGRRTVPLVWAHDYTRLPLGKITHLEADSVGLKFAAQFAESDFAREVLGLYEDGTLDSFSVGFRPLQWRDGRPGEPKRTYTDVELYEISSVVVPANEFARVERALKGYTPAAQLAQALDDLQAALWASDLSPQEKETIDDVAAALENYFGV